MKRLSLLGCALAMSLYSVIPLVAAQQTVFESTALDDYIEKDDPNFRYFHYHTEQGAGFTTYFISMTSQQWRSADEVDRILWEHELMITVPWILHSDSENTAFLLVDGGKNDDDLVDDVDPLMAVLVQALGSVTVHLKQIPNQPLRFTDELHRDRKEDELLAYGMHKFLLTGDPEWVVHLPMTKAVVRAMDVVQEFLEEEADEVLLFDVPKIHDFILAGGSKRGWTTWLTAAVEAQRAQGSRVKAIIPISADLLNLDEQFVHHWETYGFYSPAIQDYVEFDLPCRAKTVEGKHLLEIIDPYEYRDRFTMPKLILNSAGDEFFLPDSSQFYYDELPGLKHLRYTPNTDHSQSQDLQDIVAALISWIDDVNDGNPGPQFSWSMEPDGSIQVRTVTQPKSVRLRQATNPVTRDFRLDTIGPAWTSTSLQDMGDGIYRGGVMPPSQGWTAFTVELTFDEPALLEADQVYTTGVRVVPDFLPFEGTDCPEFPAIGPQTPGFYQPATDTFALTSRVQWNPDTVVTENLAGLDDPQIDINQFLPDIVVAHSLEEDGWLPISGDWNGDGRDGVGLFDPQTHTYFLYNHIVLDNPDTILTYEWTAGGIPVVGDWNGDGQDSLGVYFPATRTFSLKNELTPGNADTVVTYAAAGDDWVPVAGDWNGSGKDGLGLFDPSARVFYLKNEIPPGDFDFVLGYPRAPLDWTPLAGDWDGDGRDTLGLYQPGTGTFYLKNTLQPGLPDKILRYEGPPDGRLPVLGLWK